MNASGSCCRDGKWWVADYTYTAVCENGASLTVTRQARSEVSYEDARRKARDLAKAEAEAEKTCLFTSTQCAQVPCMLWYPPVCVTRTSPISQENADYEALTAAQSAASGLC